MTATVQEGEVCTLSIAKLSELLARKSLSHEELVEAYVSRVRELNTRLNGYITVLAGAALDAAKKFDSSSISRPLSPLHGIPYGLKDTFYTKAIRTTAASAVLRDWVPALDATIYERLTKSGAILLGKQNTWEFGTGLGETDEMSPFPEAINPWDVEAFTGGSSSGTATCVAAGLAAFGIGGDTGGSVRAPAAAQALFGLKPTYGCLSRFGILPNSPSFDGAGIITRNAADAALVLQDIAGQDPRDRTTVSADNGDYADSLNLGIAGLRIGFIRTFHERDVEPDPDVAAAVDEVVVALRQLGADIVDIALGSTLQDFRLCKQIIGQAESLSVHSRDFCEHYGEMSTPLQDKFLSSLVISGSDVFDAMKWRMQLNDEIESAFRCCDAIVCAGPLHAVPDRGDAVGRKQYMVEAAFCCFNVSGHPAAAVCAGFDRAGRPLSIQVVGPYFGEQLVLQIAHAYERETRWIQQKPLPNVASVRPVASHRKQDQTSTCADDWPVSEDFIVNRLKMIGMENPPPCLVHRASHLNAATLRSIGAVPRGLGRDVDFCYFPSAGTR